MSASFESTTIPPAYDEGVRAAGALDDAAAILVVGRDPELAAWAARGLARGQATRRRVAIGDLVGEVGPLQALVPPDDDAHGITDSFLYGVSLNRIARPVAGEPNLFVLPSGSEPVASAEILGSERWRRLAAGFREVGALLLLVAPGDAPGLDALATMVDGIVHAGDATGLLPDAPPPLAVIAPPSTRRRGGRADASPTAVTAEVPRPTPDTPPDAGAASPPRTTPAEATGFAAALAVARGALDDDATARGAPPPDDAPVAPSAPADRIREAVRARAAEAEDAARRRTPGGAAASAPDARAPLPDRTKWLLTAGALAIAAAGYWFYLRPTTANQDEASTLAAGARPSRTAAARADSVRRDSLRRDSARSAAAADSLAADGTPPGAIPPTRPGETLPRLTVANVADSARALGYAVYVQSSNTPEGAILDARTMATLPSFALTPLLDRDAPWYRLLVGAYPTRAEAERLLADLRARKVLGAGSGSIVRAPYALQLDARLPASDAPKRIGDLAAKGTAAYLLSNGDGTVGVYAGAFETPAQAAFLARNLQAAGLRPTLVYRTGRSL